MMKSQLSVAAIILASLSSTVSGSHCNTLFTEFQRRQLAEFASEDPYTAADAGGEEKHVPFLTIDDSNRATIVVGNGDVEGGVWHPMVPSEDPNEVHWITHIMAVDQNNQTVAMSQLNADTDSYPSMTFQVPPGVTQLTPYSWCNIHGFWIGDTVVLDKVAAEEGGAAADCAVSSFHPDTWPSLHADFTRLQNAVFLSDAPFDESNGEKHVPYITLTDDYSNGSIIVGNPEGEIHPMDGEAPHWITEIYVVDQTGTILDLTSLDPTNVDIATYEFDIPEKNANGDDVTSVKAYAWCNIHGLYEGPTVEVAATSSSPGNAAAGTSEAENSALNIARNGRKSVVLAGAAIVAGLNAL